jgi:hypothetical protein
MAYVLFSDWGDDELFDELALRQDRGEPVGQLAEEIRARGGNPFPDAVERGVTYEAQKLLRNQ